LVRHGGTSDRIRLSHGLVAEIHRRQPAWDQLPIGIPALPTDYEKETRMTSSIEKHAALVDHGWRCRVDGKWISPDPDDRRARTLAAAWAEHREHDADASGGTT
jgi:hypothetical protein